MLLERNRGPVASWRFEGEAVSELTWQTLERSLSACQAVTSILSARNLLLPARVAVSRWMRAGQHGVADGKRIEKTDLKIGNGTDIFREVHFAAQEALEVDAAYPLTIEISGSGVVKTGTGDLRVNDLVWLRTTTLDRFVLSVNTQSDAWLQYSLKGEDQREIWSLNAERLAETLKEIQQQTGFELEQGVESPYSIISGFYLNNIRYRDGSVADVS